MSATPIRTVKPREACCEACKTFRCAGCGGWVPWSFGAADDMPDHCDDCWAKAHGKVAA